MAAVQLLQVDTKNAVLNPGTTSDFRMRFSTKVEGQPEYVITLEGGLVFIRQDAHVTGVPITNIKFMIPAEDEKLPARKPAA